MSRNAKELGAANLSQTDEHIRQGENFRKAFPIDESSCFAQLLRDIDKVYRSRRSAKQ